MTIYIGDVHGKYNQYHKLLDLYTDTIQVGDMGVGFLRPDGRNYRNPSFDKMKEGNHRFIRGNHDNPAACARHKQCILDGTVEGSTMFVGGALSIDQSMRTVGIDWWPAEELSIPELNRIIDKYISVKPDVMVTHTAPEEVGITVSVLGNRGKHFFRSRTSLALQEMLSAHSPKLWVFGHYHYSFDAVANGTRFVCLNELEVKELSP